MLPPARSIAYVQQASTGGPSASANQQAVVSWANTVSNVTPTWTPGTSTHHSDPATQDQLAYARLLIKEAQRHGGLGWLDYDRAFRQQVAADPSIRWNTLIPGLQASTILGQQQAGPGLFCTLCRQVDHTRSQCALGCLEPPPVTSTESVQAPPVVQGRRKRLCISWNRGSASSLRGNADTSMSAQPAK